MNEDSSLESGRECRRLRGAVKSRGPRALLTVACLFSLGLFNMESQFISTSSPQTKVKDEKQTKRTGGNKSGFNYTDFWAKAMERAQESLKSEEEETVQSPCPKVYVYDLPPNLLDTTDKATQFGPKVKVKGEYSEIFDGILYKTKQYAFATLLEERLRKSKQCRTLDPSEADLFYAPVLPASKNINEWEESCRGVTGEMVRDGLTFLNSTNACKHFFVVGKGHVDVHNCDGWFSNPIKELRPAQRLAYSNYSFVLDSHGAHRYDKNDTTHQVFPNLASVPYPSSLHFRKADTELAHLSLKRTILMNFVGKSNHGDLEVREKIHEMCIGYKDKNICEFVPKYHAKQVFKAKAQVTFCLEPAGDTPGRKSISDSITFGCIPVIFSELTDDVAPWFWLDWKDRARVLVPREEFVAGRIDLKKLLQSIPPELLELMRKTLRQKARKFQYSVDDDQEDGVRVILDNLYRQVIEKEQQGVCGY